MQVKEDVSNNAVVLLEFDAVQIHKQMPQLRRNILPPSSGLKLRLWRVHIRLEKGQAGRMSVSPEDGASMFVRNVGHLPTSLHGDKTQNITIILNATKATITRTNRYV
jgi:hypothetical protein